MAAITASMVAELRGKTDAPMMECKKALTEADGDMAKAEELLRVKLGNKAGKAATRITAEGVVTASMNGTTGAMLETNCETDFVTKNDSFLAMANTAAALIAKHNPADIAALSALPCSQDGYGPTLEDVRKGLIGKIGENMTFRRFKRFASGAKLASYLHGSRIGVVVDELRSQEEVVIKSIWEYLDSIKGISGATITASPQARLNSIEPFCALSVICTVKGSITVNGVSLTVNLIHDTPDGCEVSINLIPHTVENTALGSLQAGSRVNLEIDLIARYVERMLSAGVSTLKETE